jgi:hypothetical protein
MAFLDSLFSLFAGSADPGAVKKRQLKELAKNLRSNKYSKFYRIKTGQADPSLAKFFWDMYKVVATAHVLMQNALKSVQLKQIVIDAFLEKPALDIRARLSPEAIEQRAQTGAPEALAKQLRREAAELAAAFDNNRIAAIDGCYNLIITFTHFVSFDFFFLLKKFDPKMADRNFSKVPAFEALPGDAVTEDLKDFLELVQGIDPDQNWKTVLKVLKTYKNDVDVVSPDQWGKLLLQLRDLRRSLILEMMIRHIDKNPGWASKSKISNEHIAEPYLESLRTGIEETIETIANSKRNAQIRDLAMAVFDRADINRLKFYTEKGSEIYVKKGFDGFLYAQGMNYLKAFILDYFKKDIRELCDLLLIRGQWISAPLSQPLSDGFHNIMALSEELIAFDEALADNGGTGGRLKLALVKADRDKGQAKYVRLILKSLNEEAQATLVKGAKNLIVLGQNFKKVLEDGKKTPRELITNWKELEASSDAPLIPRITEAYKKIYYLVQLLQLLLQTNQEDS